MLEKKKDEDRAKKIFKEFHGRYKSEQSDLTVKIKANKFKMKL